MGKTITTINNHKIILGEDGVVYCDCPAWKFSVRKHCKHFDQFFASVGIAVKTKPEPVPQEPVELQTEGTYSERVGKALGWR
jgi:hypothetical protein